MTQSRDLDEVVKEFPAKTNTYLRVLMQESEGIRRQFEPSVEELSFRGELRPWVGKINTGIEGLERMYRDRAIIMPTLACAAFCRHCVRKSYMDRRKKGMDYGGIDKALDYIEEHPELREILITGGDPLMDPEKLEYVIKGLREIEHISTIRIGTRVVSTDPRRVTNEVVKMLAKYNGFRNRVEISPQFNHPDEITPEAEEAIEKLYDTNIRMYNQSVLLKGINDDEETLEELFMKLRELGVESHYLYHCAPVEGVDHFRTTVQRGIDIKRYFRGGHMSGRANPQYIVLTPVGKVEPGIDGEILGKKGDYLEIRTPYRVDEFKKIDPNFKLPKGCGVDENGFIIAEYLDGKWFQPT